MKTLSVMEKINKITPLYLCVDFENLPFLCTPVKRDAEVYCKNHNCTISFYPIGTYTEQEY